MKSNRNKNREQGDGIGSRVAGFVLVVLMLIPVLALWSYDWHDVPWLNAQGGRTPVNLIGLAGAIGAFAGYSVFGLAVWLIPVWMVVFGMYMLLGRLRRPWVSLIWAIILQISVCSLLQLAEWPGLTTSLRIWREASGGAIGWFVTSLCLKPILGALGCAITMIVLAVVALGFGVGWGNWHELFLDIRDRIEERRLRHASEAEKLDIEERRLAKKLEAEQRQAARDAAREERERAREERRLEREERERRKEEEKAERERAYEEQKERLRQERERQEELERERASRLSEETSTSTTSAKPAPSTIQPSAPSTSDDGDAAPPPPPYELPSVHILSPVTSGKAEYGDVEEKQRILVETLKEFRLNVEVTDVALGPVVTIFELLPAPGIRPEQIAAMAKTIEMRLHATSIRIEAPIPGKGVIGVEIPNEKASSVTVREILEGPVWAEATRRMHLPMLLGKDSSGRDLVCDLASMPHLLVAGATGSGKSVCMNAILTGLLMCRSPEELRLILVDPKVVEFTGYNAIPHLLVPIITDAKKVSLGLVWLIHEMEKRYRILSAAGVKNIESYNSRKPVQPDMFADPPEAQQASALPERLPYIVVVIDELADLMLQVGREIEDSISRLAAKARAVGIHLILATQKPIVKVVTGTIKSNVPARIAFQVAQRIDSQTIIDRVGAESLIGRGDMLFLNPRSSKLVRAQGAFIGDADAEAVCDFIRDQGGPRYMQEIQQQIETGNGEDVSTSQHAPSRSGQSGERSIGGGRQDFTGGGAADAGAETSGPPGDDLYAAALDVVRRTHRASTSSLQRALRIGYTRAARLIDQMEEEGIVGPPRGADPREILIDLDAEAAHGGDGTDEVGDDNGDGGEE
ncbi:MAG: DNA translocase FtsK 4TM domain-containing protein [Kiritimatiellae bacterium]|nr:DNA translocase FtsK 4TM domain-containing protein [Kiritimatiellia bacterium]